MNKFLFILVAATSIGQLASAEQSGPYTQTIQSFSCDQNHFGQIVNQMKIDVDSKNSVDFRFTRELIEYENQITGTLGQRLKIDPQTIAQIQFKFADQRCYQSLEDVAVISCRSDFGTSHQKEPAPETQIDVTTKSGQLLTTQMYVEVSIDKITTERALFGKGSRQHLRIVLGEDAGTSPGTIVLGSVNQPLGMTHCQKEAPKSRW